MFQYIEDAKKFYKALKVRLEKFDLELAEEKSKIITFGRFARENSEDGKVDTFDFLGFTHICGKTKKSGKFTVVHRTSRKKMKQKRMNVKTWLKQNMHTPVKELITNLNRKIVGHYNYYGISGNYKGIKDFYCYVRRQLFRVLQRRGQKHPLTWDNFNQVILKFNPIALPSIKVDIWKMM
jgi:hypothetical protein